VYGSSSTQVFRGKHHQAAKARAETEALARSQGKAGRPGASQEDFRGPETVLRFSPQPFRSHRYGSLSMYGLERRLYG
jgi:hypothetical protein